MGVNIKTGGGGGGGGANPRKHRKKDTCKNAPKAVFEVPLTEEEIKRLEEEQKDNIPGLDGVYPVNGFLKTFMPGANDPVFTVFTNRGFMGDEPIQDYPGFNVYKDGKPQSPPYVQPEGSQYGGDSLEDGFKGTELGSGWRKDGEYDLEKSEFEQDGQNKKKIKVQGTDKKNKALKKKLNKNFKDKPLGDAVEELVKDGLGEGVISTDRIDKDAFNKIIIDQLTINEDFLNVAINRCALLGGAEWHISSEDDFWFYRPEDRINSQPITTQWWERKGAGTPVFLTKGPNLYGPEDYPDGKASGYVPDGLNSPDGKYTGTSRIEPNVKKGSAKATNDASKIKNRVQVSGGKEPERKKEIVPLPQPEDEPTPEDFQPDEVHLTYPPVDLSIRGPRRDEDMPLVYIKYFDGITPSVQLPVFVDWTGRPGTDLYSVPQQLSGPAPEGLAAPSIVAFFNFHEKAVRFADNPLNFETPPGPPRPNPPLPPDWRPYMIPTDNNIYIEVEYTYERPVYFTMSDPDSIEKYGVREARIVTPSGHSGEEMRALAQATLREWSQPRVSLEVTVFEDAYLLGQTCKVMIPELGLLKEDGSPYMMPIYEREKIFDIDQKHKRWPGEVILRLGKKPMSFDEFLGQFMENRVKGLEENAFNRENPLEETQFEQKRLGFSEYVKTSVITVSTGEIDVGEIDVDVIT